MRMLRAVRQHEGAVARTLAARVVFEQLEVLQAGNEARLPDVELGNIAAVDRHMLALALPLVRLTEALAELVRVVKDEIAVVIEIERHRRVVGAGQSDGFLSRAIEKLILAVQ